MKPLMTLTESALLVVAALLLFEPASRAGVLPKVNTFLFIAIAFTRVWQMHRAGTLGLPIEQLHLNPKRPRIGLVGACAVVLSIAASVAMM